jgi:hypothetical protein
MGYMTPPAEMPDDELGRWVENFKSQPPTMDCMGEFSWACRVADEHKRRSARMTVNRPVRFTGSDAERARNRATHCFVTVDHEEPQVCMDCDCKTWHVSADYPCGSAVPRETLVA